MLPLDTGTRVSAFQGLSLGEEVALPLCFQALRRPRGGQGWASFLRWGHCPLDLPPRPEAGKKQVRGRSPRGRRVAGSRLQSRKDTLTTRRPSAGLGSTGDLLNPCSGPQNEAGKPLPSPPESTFRVGSHTATGSHHPCPGQSLTHPGIPSKSGRRNLGRQRPQLSELLGRGSAGWLNVPFPNPGGDASVLKHLAT